jgi:hypothetical protein
MTVDHSAFDNLEVGKIRSTDKCHSPLYILVYSSYTSYLYNSYWHLILTINLPA